MSKYWKGDWQSRVHESMQRLGYSNLLEFARAHPGESFEGLADLTNVAPIQLKLMMKDEAAASGQMRSFAADALSRFLIQYLPAGSQVLAAAAIDSSSKGFDGSPGTVNQRQAWLPVSAS